jgi:DNA excision repair protein ERCC-2
MLVELARVVPDGMVCFFVSYLYMDQIISQWNSMSILSDIMQHKLIFIETQDVVETTLALDNFRRACDCGRGAVFFSVARGKVAEGIDFDRHYGRYAPLSLQRGMCPPLNAVLLLAPFIHP